MKKKYVLSLFIYLITVICIHSSAYLQTATIDVPGANDANDVKTIDLSDTYSDISIFFSKLDVESNFDTLTIYAYCFSDGLWYPVRYYAGAKNHFWSGYLGSSKILLNYVSDGSVPKTGYTVSKIACYKTTSPPSSTYQRLDVRFYASRWHIEKDNAWLVDDKVNFWLHYGRISGWDQTPQQYFYYKCDPPCDQYPAQNFYDSLDGMSNLTYYINFKYQETANSNQEAFGSTSLTLTATTSSATRTLGDEKDPWSTLYFNLYVSDVDPPTVVSTITINTNSYGWLVNPVTYTTSCGDISGIKKYQWRVGEIPIAWVDNSTNNSFNVTDAYDNDTSATQKIYVRAMDNWNCNQGAAGYTDIGNAVAHKYVTAKVDFTPPSTVTNLSSINQTFNQYTSDTKIYFKWTKAADAASLTDGYSIISNFGSQVIPDTTKDIEEERSNVSGHGFYYGNFDSDGNWYFSIRAKDYADNWATAYQWTGAYWIDLVKPTTDYAFSGTAGNNGWYVTTGNITLASNDDNQAGESYYKLNLTNTSVYDLGMTQYEWIEIVPGNGGYTGTSLSMTDDSVSTDINMGFTFNYYGTDYTALKICANGFLSFNYADATFPSRWKNISFPSDDFDAMIAPLWDDWHPENHGDVYYYSDAVSVPKRFIVTWSEVANSVSNNSDYSTFQVVLYENGEIKFNYKSIGVTGYSNSYYPYVTAGLNLGNNTNYSTIVNYNNCIIPDYRSFSAKSYNKYSSSVPVTNQGNNILYYYSSDFALNCQDVQSKIIKIDTIDPDAVTDLRSSSHISGEWTNNNQINAEWTEAWDATSGLDGYSIYVSTNSHGTPNTTKNNENGDTDYLSSVLSDDTYYINVRTVDNAGNWDDSYKYIGPFYIDTVKPDVILSLSESSDYIYTVSNTNLFYSDKMSVSQSFEINVIAIDTASGLSTTACTGSFFNMPIDNSYQAASPNFILNYTNLTSTSSDSGILRVSVTDVAGNNIVKSVTVVRDIVLPNCELTAPENNFCDSETVYLQAYAEDNAGGAGIKVVEFWDGVPGVGTKLGEDNSSAGGWSFDWITSNLDDGTHYIYCRTYDNVLNYKDSPGTTIIVDNTDPSTAIISYPSENQHLKGNIEISANVADSLSGILKVEFWLGVPGAGTKLGEDTNGVDGWKYTWNTGSVSDGAYEINLRVYDRSYNYINSNVRNIVVDNTIPVIQNFNINYNYFSPDNNEIKDTAIISANIDELNFDSYYLKIKNSSNNIVRSFIGYETEIFFVWNGKDDSNVYLTQDIYTVKIEAFDTAGNVVDESKNLTIDLTNPVINFGGDTVVTENQVFILNASLSSDDLSGIFIYKWDWNFSDGLDWINADSIGVISELSYTNNGTKQVTLYIQDIAGNFDTASILVNVQTPADLQILYTKTDSNTVSQNQQNLIITMAVKNFGEADGNINSANLDFFIGAMEVTAQYVLNRADTVTVLTGDSIDTLIFLVNVDNLADTGIVTVDGSVTGTDYNAGFSTNDNDASIKTNFLLQKKAELVIYQTIAVPDTISANQQNFLLKLYVKNLGEASAELTNAELKLIHEIDGDVASRDYSYNLNGGLVIIPGNSEKILIFETDAYETAVKGKITLDGSVTGYDTNSFEIIGDNTADSKDIFAVESPDADLLIGSINVIPDVISTGQQNFVVTFPVYNLGMAGGIINSASLTFKNSFFIDKTLDYTVVRSDAENFISGFDTVFLSFNVSVDENAETGMITVDASMNAEDANSHQDKSDNNAADTDVFLVESHTFPKIISLTSDSITVSQTQQNIILNLISKNNGEADGEIFSINFFFVNSLGETQPADYTYTKITGTDTINAGISETFMYYVDISNIAETGIITFIGDIFLKDENSGIIYSDTFFSADNWIVQSPAQIDIIEVDAFPWILKPGDLNNQVTLTLKNTGEAVAKITDGELFLKNSLGNDVTSDYIIVWNAVNTEVGGNSTENITFDVDVKLTAQSGTMVLDGAVYYKDKNLNDDRYDTNSLIIDTWIIDGQIPVILSKSIDKIYISPNNDNIKDTVLISFELSESYFDSHSILIKNNLNTIVKNFNGTEKLKSYEWNGKDNSSNFVSDGIYSVYIQANDLAGNFIEELIDTVVVDVTKPVSDCGSDTTIFLNQVLTINSGNSTDNLSGIATVKWDFNFNDGIDWDNPDSTGVSAQHSYSALGTYKITLFVEDNAGNYDTSQINVEVVFPKIIILLPENNCNTNVQLIEVSGTCYINNNSTIEIFKNNVLQFSYITNSINWSGTCSLNEFQNIINVRLSDSYGNQAWDTITVNYDSEVSLIITSPMNNTDTNQKVIDISGTADAEDGAELFIFNDGIFQTQSLVNANSWSGTVLLTGIGNEVTVKIIDKYTNENWDTIIVNYDSEVSLIITSPMNNTDTNQKIIDISGTTDAEDGAELFIFSDGTFQSQTIASANNWSGTVLLTGIGNEVSVKIIDKYTNENWDTIIVNYDSEVSLIITSPLNNTDTNKEIINVSGTTDAEDGAELFIFNDGIFQTQTIVNSNNWSGTVLLTGVGNEVSVKIIDKYTNENWDTIIVNYDSEVSLIITSPLNNTDTNQEIINVSGTTDAEDGAELFIFNDGIFQTQTIINAGSWSGTVLLTGIGNYVSVKVIDKYTNENWDTITLNYVDSVEVKILFPENNIDTTNSNIVLAGTSSNVTDGTIIFININGVLAATTNVSSNSWNSNVVLSDSVNVISVRIVDDFTNEDWDTIIINYHYHNFEVNPLNEIRSETSGNKVYFSKKVFNSGNNYDSFGLEVGNQKLWNCYYLVDNDSDGVYDLGENELITSIYNLKNNDTFFLFLVIEIPDNSVAYETAVISETYVCLADNNYVNGTDTVTVLSPNLILTKNESSFYGYQPEDTVELNVNIYNSGNGTAYEVIYYDTLSVDFSFINTSFEIDTGFGFQNLTSINDSDELEIISSNVLKCNFLKNSFSGLEPASGFKLKYIIKIK